MILTPELREQVRLSILRYCLAETREGFVRANLASEGFKLDREVIALEIAYLADKEMLVTYRKDISPEFPFWRTTAQGRDYLAVQGEEKA